MRQAIEESSDERFDLSQISEEGQRWWLSTPLLLRFNFVFFCFLLSFVYQSIYAFISLLGFVSFFVVYSSYFFFPSFLHALCFRSLFVVYIKLLGAILAEERERGGGEHDALCVMSEEG